MSAVIFSGRLYYDGCDDFVDVTSLIMRGNNIGFSLASVTVAHGRWSASGTALLESEGIYIVRDLRALQMGVPCRELWDILFRFVAVESELLSVEGDLSDGVGVFHFEGDLNARATS